MRKQVHHLQGVLADAQAARERAVRQPKSADRSSAGAARYLGSGRDTGTDGSSPHTPHTSHTHAPHTHTSSPHTASASASASPSRMLQERDSWRGREREREHEKEVLDLKLQKEVVEKERDQLAAQAQEVQSREKTVLDREQQLTARDETLEEREKALEEREKALDQGQREVAAKHATFETARKEQDETHRIAMETMRQEMQAQEHEAMRVAGLLARRGGELAELQTKLEQAHAKLDADVGSPSARGDTTLDIAKQCALQLEADVEELRSCLIHHVSECTLLIQAGEQANAQVGALLQSVRTEQAEVQQLRHLLREVRDCGQCLNGGVRLQGLVCVRCLSSPGSVQSRQV
jgi:DNA repair exonuclease SbcCD ATPase subunit